MKELFKIKPLKWEGKIVNDYDSMFASTPFGNYHMTYFDDSYHWGYCFDEYYDESQERCESIKDGKKQAWEDWLSRIRSTLIKSSIK